MATPSEVQSAIKAGNAGVASDEQMKILASMATVASQTGRDCAYALSKMQK